MSEPSGPTEFLGRPASDGVAVGRVRFLDWRVPRVRHGVVPRAERDGEIERLLDAFASAREELRVVRERVADTLGAEEARVFDPQILMLDDPALVDGALRYVERNRIGAARAFDWRVLELKETWSRALGPTFADRLNDLEDVRRRVLAGLLRLPRGWDPGAGRDAAVVASDLTPSLLARLIRAGVAALAVDAGTRASHWAILARSARIPAVAGLGDLAKRAPEGRAIVVDGRRGRVVLDPDEREIERFRRRRATMRALERETAARPPGPPTTLDGRVVALRANLDLPGEAVAARRCGAAGVGLLRAEFLAVGRRVVPDEDEQFRAYREVVEAFAGHPVCVRTFDLGGDKFPWLPLEPGEANPLLGARGVRLHLREPDLFVAQLRALLRAAVHGDLRIMAPLVTAAAELDAVRALIEEARAELAREGRAFSEDVRLGSMVETPAAALAASDLARAADFLSIGTNDLAQYTLAVDRADASLASAFDEFHPSVLRQIAEAVEAGRSRGIEVAACGEMASRPLGAALLLGLGVDCLSVSWPALPEIGALVERCRMDDLRRAAAEALRADTGEKAMRAMGAALAAADDRNAATSSTPGIEHSAGRSGRAADRFGASGRPGLGSVAR